MRDRARLLVLDDVDALAREAASEFRRLAASAVASRGRFAVALAGGSTPRRLYALLSDPSAPFQEEVPWNDVHFFWSDERCVPPDDPRSNYRMAREEMLDRVPVAPENVHRIEADRPDAAGAAADYERELRRVLAVPESEIPRLDLALLGMGADGHTASLFPGSEALEIRDRLVAAPWVETLRARRVTLTLPIFDRAAAVVFLVAGTDKAQTLRAVWDPSAPPGAFPCQRVRPIDGELIWLVDRPAASLLEPR